MNNLLQLKGAFLQKKNKSVPGCPELPVNTTISVKHLEKLKQDLEILKDYWSKEDLLRGALISVYYIDVIAKSRRISGTFCAPGISSNDSIVGAKFVSDVKIKHIITHYVSLKLLDKTILKYEICVNILKNDFSGSITDSDVKKLNKGDIAYGSLLLSRTEFIKVLIDAHYVEKFGISMPEGDITEDSIITIYKTDSNTVDLMDKIGIKILPRRIFDDTTILMSPDQLSILLQKAPYLISMAVSDLSKYADEELEFEDNLNKKISIPSPKNEPIIGVIDTMFDKNVYFSEWVEFKNMLDKNIELSPDDYVHGTAVSSIIVDGPAGNPKLDDGCGRFRVRHFGVATGSTSSSFSILKAINEIITLNKDIKVWNLSLGSPKEINPNFISPEAAILDRIQYDNDVIFVIAGTNKKDSEKEDKFIGAPADSINSLVVNSVDFKGKPSTYSRTGPVLSFFIKPDISYYGGHNENKMRVCTPMGEALVAGTSFAAPWIARKLSYLVDIVGLSREVAKALIIDSATGWKHETISPHILGYGVVPRKIDDILKSPNEEIRFILSGVSEEYDTYTYNLPVPAHNNKHPFIAKATLCYFPYCSRNQGVDYTNTELDIKFGRINKEGIKSIDNNYQDKDGYHVYEGNARKFYRKWDNVKHIREIVKNNRARDVYTGIWGLSVKTKERTKEKFGKGLKFGVVITLKEINNINRIDDFINQCSLRGWLVTKVDVENRIEIYNVSKETIKFTDQ
jgi:hypothetical protein